MSSGYGSPHVYRGNSGGGDRASSGGSSSTTTTNKSNAFKLQGNPTTPIRVVRTTRTPPTHLVQLGASSDYVTSATPHRTHGRTQQHGSGDRSPSPEGDELIEDSSADVTATTTSGVPQPQYHHQGDDGGDGGAACSSSVYSSYHEQSQQQYQPRHGQSSTSVMMRMSTQQLCEENSDGSPNTGGHHYQNTNNRADDNDDDDDDDDYTNSDFEDPTPMGSLVPQVAQEAAHLLGQQQASPSYPTMTTTANNGQQQHDSTASHAPPPTLSQQQQQQPGGDGFGHSNSSSNITTQQRQQHPARQHVVQVLSPSHPSAPPQQPSFDADEQQQQEQNGGVTTQQPQQQQQRPANNPKPTKPPKINLGNKELIGKGTFGNVYRAVDMDTMATVAVKEVTLITDESRELKKQIHALEREIRVMQKLNHPHIVKYLGASRDGPKLNIIMEFIAGGTIASYIRQYGLEPPQAAYFTKQVVLGLQYLHSKNIAHRDLKGDNLFVDTHGHVKVGDFGTSKELQTIRMTNSVAGTPYFMAPEVVTCGGHGIEADVWSLGCCVIQMLTGKPPFHQYDNPYTVMFNVSKGNIEEQIPPTLPPEVQDFVKKCTALNPSERWTCSQLLQHPWIRDVRLPPSSIAAAAVPSSSHAEEEHRQQQQEETGGGGGGMRPPPAAVAKQQNKADNGGGGGPEVMLSTTPQPSTPPQQQQQQQQQRQTSGGKRPAGPTGTGRVIGGKLAGTPSRDTRRQQQQPVTPPESAASGRSGSSRGRVAGQVGTLRPTGASGGTRPEATANVKQQQPRGKVATPVGKPQGKR